MPARRSTTAFCEKAGVTRRACGMRWAYVILGGIFVHTSAVDCVSWKKVSETSSAFKKTCIDIDKDMNVETSYLSNMLKHKPSNVFIQQTYLFSLNVSSKEE